MNTTSRVLVALGAVTLIASSALAQQAPAQPPQAPPSSIAPAVPPAAPAAPAAAAAGAQAKPDTQTASGELLSVDSKASTLSVKTASAEMTFKYDNDTKISGATKGVSGLATMAGSQVTVSYKKDGASNIATSIDVKAAPPRP
jgi:hypothetical protein